MTKGAWVDGLAEWTEGDTLFLSIAFTWRLREARDRAIWGKAMGYRVRAGGPATFERWSKILRGPWRFGYDDMKEREEVRRMMALLRSSGVRPHKMQVYCMIGHESPAECQQRIEEIIAWGGEPYCQRNMKLTSLEKTPWVRPELGWTIESLRHMARWANRRIWRYAPLSEYKAGTTTSRISPAQLALG